MLKPTILSIVLVALVGTVQVQTVKPSQTAPEPRYEVLEKNEPSTTNIKKTAEKAPEKPTEPIWVTNPNKCDLNTQWVWEDGSCHNKPVEPVATVARSVTTQGVEQWRSLVSQYDWDVDLVLRIMQCESGGNPDAVGDTTTAYASYGLMQIRALPGRPAPAWLLIPENNIQYAYQLSGGGVNFQPWSCYFKI